MKAGLATIALRRYDVFHALDLAAEAGFERVEIWGKPPHMPAEFDEDHVRKVRDRIRGNSMKPSMFGSYANPAAPDYEQKAADALAAAKLLGARTIRVWAGNKEPGEAGDDLWTLVAKSLHEFALQAEDEGISLAMEMHSGTLCATPEGALRVIDMAGAPHLKLNYQVVDMINPDLERTIGMIGDYVVNVHAQNYRPSPIESGKMELCLLSEGVVDYDQVLSLLAQRGFNKCVEVEFLKGEHVSEQVMLESLKQDAQYLRSLTQKHSPQV